MPLPSPSSCSPWLAVGYLTLEQDVGSVAPTQPAIISSTDAPAAEAHQGFLYGRISTDGRAAYEGRLRWGGGEELRLERAGDLGEGNAGMLIFVDGRERPEYLPWTDFEQIELDRPAEMYPPFGSLPPEAAPKP